MVDGRADRLHWERVGAATVMGMEMPRAMDWITRLIEAETVSRDPNRPVIDLVCAEAERLGLTPTVLPHATDPGKANLVVTVPAQDGTTTGGIVLSGHSDVVPVDGQSWSSEPFRAEVREGRLYGRGAADMKGFIGICVDRLKDFVAADLAEPLHLVLTYDEEVGCRGGEVVVKEIADLGLVPRIAFVGEPSMMQVIRGHKSVNAIDVTFCGVAAHSSLAPQAVNAVEHAARFITKVCERTDHWRKDGPFDDDFVIAHSTGGVNTITGGIAFNTVPEECVVQMEFRSVPAHGPRERIIEEFRELAAQIEREMKAEDDRASVTFDVLASVPGLDTAPDAPAVQLAHELGGVPSEEKVTYATEAGQFAESGIDAVIVGPGDIADAHTADESVSLEQLVDCEKFVQRLVEKMTLVK